MTRSLDTTKNSPESQVLRDTLNRNVVGQQEAGDVLVDMVEAFQAGFTRPNRPVGTALFMGSTGCGKTHTTEMLCKGLFGDESSILKIDGGEYQLEHHIAKLTGSPAGYLGFRETKPMLCQANLDKYHTEKLKLSVLLVDEAEKCSDTLWNIFLSIMDRATLTMGDNSVSDFSKVIIIFTSNLGAAEMSDVTDGTLGFNTPEVPAEHLHSKIETVAKEAAKRRFSPEFYNRLNHVCVFKTLTEAQIKEVLEIELGRLQNRLLFSSKVKFFFHVKPLAKAKLIAEGFSKRYGARHLSRAIEQRIITPLARLVASGQLLERDTVLIDDVGKEKFDFSLAEETL